MGLLKTLGLDAESYIKRQNDELEYFRRERERKGLPEHYGPSTGSGQSSITKKALINMISTADLDQVIADCAPELSNTIYETNAKTKQLIKMLEAERNYAELQGQYDELQKHYDELKREHDTLLNFLKMRSQAN